MGKLQILRAFGLLVFVAATANAGNLLTNHSFESELFGWTTAGDATIRTANPEAFAGFNYVFGESTPRFEVWQDIPLTLSEVSTAAIDAEFLDVMYGGWQSGFEKQMDAGEISVSFFDETMSELSSNRLDPFYSNHTWVQQKQQTEIPAGTRTIRYHFEGVRDAGSNTDAFLDETFLEIVSRIPGDADRNGMVNAADLNAVALNWLQTDTDWEDGDFTDDNVVNPADLNVLGQNWLFGVQRGPLGSQNVQTVPEPSGFTMVLACLSALCLVRNRSSARSRG